MNKEETKKAIEFMQAYLDGKEIQVTAAEGGWVRAGAPSWSWCHNVDEYRIKPEPRVIEIKDGEFLLFNIDNNSNFSPDQPKGFCTTLSHRLRADGPAKFVEVLDD